MGITKLSLDRIEKYLHPNSQILIIGCQNLYNSENYGEIAQDYFRSLGHTVKSIDIYECNGADIADLRDNLQWQPEYDLVLQHGTIEHVDGSLYWPLKNIHDACKCLGMMIHENPKTGNWPEHGQHYFTNQFWSYLTDSCIYEICELTEEPAMGNYIDGWNVSCVLKKVSNENFISEDQFNEIYSQHIKSK